MLVTITLTYNGQSVSGTEECEDTEEGIESFDFYWGDGNFACDCNRSRWAIQYGADWPELECSGLDLIAAKAVTPDGRVLFDENE